MDVCLCAQGDKPRYLQLTCSISLSFEMLISLLLRIILADSFSFSVAKTYTLALKRMKNENEQY